MTELAQYYRPFGQTQPPYRFENYASTVLRSPRHEPIALPQGLSEVTGPRPAPEVRVEVDSDLTRQGGGEAIGQRIVVGGRVLDENARPVRRALIEIWQANAAGRYRHPRDQWDAPLDPNFTGAGRATTDDEGRFRFTTIRPGAYPWRNHYNAWRPAHIHFSLFGNAYAQRLVTQMYFPGDELLAFDPIYNAVPDANARARLVARFDWASTKPGWAHGFVFDIVLRGRDATPFD